MYKFLFLVLLTISCSVYGQTTNDSVYNDLRLKYMALQAKDSALNSDVKRIENGIEKFYIANKQSQGFVFGGLALTAGGVLLANITETKEFIVFPIIGTVLSVYGAILELDSFNYLNLKTKPKSKPKPKEPFTYEW